MSEDKWILVSDRMPPIDEPVLLQDKWASTPYEIYIGKLNDSKHFVAIASENLEAVGGWNGAIIESNVFQPDVYCWHPLPKVKETVV